MGHENKGDHQKLKKGPDSHLTLYLFSHIQYSKYSFDLQIADDNPGGAIFYLRLLSTKSDTFRKNIIVLFMLLLKKL